MAGYWPSSFLDRDEVEVHKNAKKGRGQYPAILTEQGFIIWLYCQVKTTKKKNMKLFCLDRNSLQPAGVRFIFSASSIGLVYNHEKLGIISYHKDLVLEWLKGSKQLLCT